MVRTEFSTLAFLDGPCTYMWTYGGTYPGLTIRRPTGQTTRVTAIGPTLTNFGVTGALGDLILTVYDKNGSAMITNDNWADDPNAAIVQSYNLAPSSTKESTTYLQVVPSNCTAIVRGVSGATGTGLVEIYNIP